MEAKEGSPAPPQESRLGGGGNQEIGFLLRRQKDLARKLFPFHFFYYFIKKHIFLCLFPVTNSRKNDIIITIVPIH